MEFASVVITLIALLISILALYYSHTSYLASLHAERYNLYEDIKLLLNDLIHTKLNDPDSPLREYLHRTKTYTWKVRWIIANDENILLKLKEIKEHLATLVAYVDIEEDDQKLGDNQIIQNAVSSLYQICGKWLIHGLDENFDPYLYLPINGAFFYKMFRKMKVKRHSL